MDKNSNAQFHLDVTTGTFLPDTSAAVSASDFLLEIHDSKSLPCGQPEMHPLTDRVTNTRLNSGTNIGYLTRDKTTTIESNMSPDHTTSLSTSGVLPV